MILFSIIVFKCRVTIQTLHIDIIITNYDVCLCVMYLYYDSLSSVPLEQRDSALSCNSLSNMPSSFHPIPAPPITVFDIPGVHYTAVYEMLRESITREHLHHELASPLTSSTTLRQLQSENSRTSLDSTGSSGFELEDSFDTDLKSPRLNGRSEQWGGSEESNGVITTTDSPRAQYKTLPRRLHVQRTSFTGTLYG